MDISPVHMDRFAHVSIYLCVCKLAYVCELAHALTYVSNLYSICNYFTFALGGDQRQISICIYVDFIHVQIWSIEFTYVILPLI